MLFIGLGVIYHSLVFIFDKFYELFKMSFGVTLRCYLLVAVEYFQGNLKTPHTSKM